jgi:U1 small nuclear ribonucleoprotein
MYGAIERIRIVKDRKGKSRSYAFIVYERERDMKGESIHFEQNKANM